MKIMVDSEYLDKLQKSLGVDAEGNAVIGKNLEVDGTTKLNGGFEPIHTYEFEDQDGKEELIIFYESVNENIGGFDFFGSINNYYYVYGNYHLYDGLFSFSCLAFDGEEQLPRVLTWEKANKNIFSYYPMLSDKGFAAYSYTLKLSFPGAGSENTAIVTILSSQYMDVINSVTDFNTLVTAQEGDCIEAIVSTSVGSTSYGTERTILGNNIRFQSGVWTVYSDNVRYSNSYQGSVINLNLTNVTMLKRRLI